MNTVLDNLPRDVKATVYADDLAIYHTGRAATSARKLQMSINTLEQWATRSGLEFSSSKTELVLFRRRKKRGEIEAPPNLRLYKKVIPARDTTRFLGMILDKRLSWKPHIQELKAKALKSLNILRVVSRQSYGPDQRTLKRLYWALCKSKMNYGAQMYTTASPNTLKMHDPIKNEAMQLATGAFRTSPVDSL